MGYMTVLERAPDFSWRNVFVLLAFLVLTLLVAVIGSFATSSGQDWYDGLEAPAFQPSGWAFGAVWTPLYVLIAIAGWLLWTNRGHAQASAALGLWSAQLVLNLLWTVIFFGLERPGFALAEIVILVLAIVGTMAVAWPINRFATVLFVPYLGWVLFATALNFEYWRLN